MTDFPFVVKLYRNPWPDTIPDPTLIHIVAGAVEQTYNSLVPKWQKDGKLAAEKNSFAGVILDPTNPREATTIAERVMVLFGWGSDMAKLIPNGVAKADAQNRFGIPNGWLIRHASYCLADGEFTWGHSAGADYLTEGVDETTVIFDGGGSGYSAEQDKQVVQNVGELSLLKVKEMRDAWLAARRAEEAGRRWYNNSDTPDRQYTEITAMMPITATGPDELIGMHDPATRVGEPDRPLPDWVQKSLEESAGATQTRSITAVGSPATAPGVARSGHM